MRALKSRWGTVLTLVLVAAAAAAAAGFLALQFTDRARVAELTPAPGAAVASASPTIGFEIGGDRRLSGLVVTVGGRDVTARARAVDGRVSVPLANLPDGEHPVTVSFRTPNVFSRNVDRRWSFEVDTAAPRLAVTAPARAAIVNRRAVRVSGTGEPGTRVTVAHGERRETTDVGPRGGWTLVARMDEGVQPIEVTAADPAGNVTVSRRRVGIDTTPPDIAVTAPGDEIVDVTDEPLIYGRVGADSPRSLTYTATVNGRHALTVGGAAAAAPDGDGGGGFTEAGAGEDAPLQVDGRRFALAPGTLAQGRNIVELAVTDPAGNTARVTRRVVVDSSDEFGEHDLVVGARGGDVADLQARLKDAGAFPAGAAASGAYDKRTVQAVRRYQRMRGLPVTGRVDEGMRRAMVGRIVVNLAARKLSVIRDGKVWKTYPIAVGLPQHPTPTGEYEVIDKQVDPTWFPPDSPWAEGLGPISPGPGNPLGTRWIGTSAPAIGIHGTYEASSIGTAASHGCLRMHIPDVEELYEEVSHGMRVIIRS